MSNSLKIESPKIAMLATGDELTTGDILNTNGQTIAKTLKDYGFQMGMHVIASDDEAEITQAINFLMQFHNILIITGGLGPTSDDRTRFALGKALNKPLSFHESSWAHIVARFAQLKMPIHDSNKQQALFPEEAEIINNPNGTANGCFVREKDKLIVMLPGPPRECISMFNEAVLPTLKQLNRQQQWHLKWRLFGVSEGQIAAKLDQLVNSYSVITGYRWEFPYLDFKIRTSDKIIIEEISLLIENIVAPHVICTTEKTATEMLREKIAQYSGMIVIEDQATFGLLQQRITTPRTINQLCFRKASFPQDTEKVVIKITGLEEFWQSAESSSRLTNLQIHFQANQDPQTIKTTIPFRNSGVVEYAVELISFHLNNLMDKLLKPD